MKVMLADTILALCRNALPYKGRVSVEGLLGITLDDEEIFLVNINETIQKEGYVNQSSSQSPEKRQQLPGSEDNTEEDTQETPTKKRRKRKRQKSKESNEEVHFKDATGDTANDTSDMKQLDEADTGNESVEEEKVPVFVKSEPVADQSYGHDNSLLGTAYSGEINQSGDFSHIFPDNNQSLGMDLQNLALQMAGPLGSGVCIRILLFKKTHFKHN